MIRSSINRLAGGSRASKRSILIAYDVFAMVLALWAAFSVRLGEMYWPEGVRVTACLALSIFAGLAALYRLHVYHIVLRYFDLRTVSRIFFGAAVAAVAWALGIYLTQPNMTVDGLIISVPRSVSVIYCGFLFMLLFMGRYLMAVLVIGAARGPSLDVLSGRRNVAIYGANSAGVSLAESVRNDSSYRFCAFIDDDPALHGQMIGGTPIYAPHALAQLATERDLDDVFLAMPNASRSQRLAAIARLNELKLNVMTVPAPEEIVSGRFTISDVRPIDVNDLLRRDPVEPLTDLIRNAVDGHIVLITGAGGSIGSEICRQIVRSSPKRLVLLDHSEFALYTIEQQLIEMASGRPEGERPEIVPIVGSMLNDKLVREIIAAQQIDTIYHAAAYKHVPLLEHNEVVGVENNVIGTLVLAKAAMDAKLTRFTMISTDKAVRPESVMGASKRVAELIIQAFADHPDCRTRFGIVRFGNVLDSSGSVVQRFRDQISRGGPVTVTHKDVTRFFMSIPEATQLVLQASAMARAGEVFVLDMGEPLKIADLARQMIKLSGMTVRDSDNPTGDIEIAYVGLRPGEKLYEELFVGGETLATSHPRIQMARERSLPMAELMEQIDSLIGAVRARHRGAVRAKLAELIAADQSDPPSAVALGAAGAA
jgi:FlaA1/EpsC-like NDP-sugar epimerase